MNAKKNDTNIIKAYANITNRWKQKNIDNSSIVEERTFVRINGKVYKINKNNKNVVFEKDIETLRPIARWMSKTFGSKIYINPTVKVPQGIRTPDFIYKKKQWNLKTIRGSSLDNIIRKTKGQSNNFILDLTNSKLNFHNILTQIENIYKSPYRRWVDIVIIKIGNNFNIYQRK